MKLYRVNIEFEGYALAESEQDAIDVYRSEALRDDEPRYETASRVRAGERPDKDWAGALPWTHYGCKTSERTVGELIADMPTTDEGKL